MLPEDDAGCKAFGIDLKIAYVDYLLEILEFSWFFVILILATLFS